jgi:hypothetical protein
MVEAKDNIDESSIWNLDFYAESITSYIVDGYDVGTFQQYLEKPSNKFLVLRHDIDFNPNLLGKMLDVEEAIGVKSSIFFRVCAKDYNIFSYELSEILQRLKKRGHEVGLHLDVFPSFGAGMSKEQFAFLQKETLEKVYGSELSGFSLHYPATNKEYAFADQLVREWNFSYHAYDDLFFRKFKYLSDSGGRWREGHFREWVGRANLLQVLTHPIWHFRSCIQENF